MRCTFIPLIVIMILTFPAILSAKSISIGYLETYTPWIVGSADRYFDRVTGHKITWTKFESGADIINALVRDEIDIGSAGSTPIAAALTLGHKIELFWILQDINFGEGLIVRKGSRILATQQLRSCRIAVPFASTSHYHLMFALQQFKIGIKEVELTYLAPEEIETAWSDGRIDATFIWNPLLDRLLRTGRFIINSGRLSRWGKLTFDGLVANRKWAAQNPDFMVDFIKSIADIDANVTENPKL